MNNTVYKKGYFTGEKTLIMDFLTAEPREQVVRPETNLAILGTNRLSVQISLNYSTKLYEIKLIQSFRITIENEL